MPRMEVLQLCLLVCALAGLANSSTPSDTVFMTLCPPGQYLNNAVCSPCPINCEDPNGINGTCQFNATLGAFECVVLDGLIQEVVLSGWPLASLSTGRLLRGMGLRTFDPDTGPNQTLANITVVYQQSFDPAFDSLIFVNDAMFVGSSFQGGQGLVLTAAEGAIPSVEDFGLALYRVNVQDTRLEPSNHHCFIIQINDGVQASETARLCAITAFINDNAPTINCTSDLIVDDVETATTTAATLATCQLSDADFGMADQGASSLEVTTSDGNVRFFVGAAAPTLSVSGTDSNVLTIIPQGASLLALLTEYQTIVDAISLGYLMNSDMEFPAGVSLSPTVTFTILDAAVAPAESPSVVTISLRPLPDKNNTLVLNNTQTLFNEGDGPTNPFQAIADFMTLETFYTVSYVRFFVSGDGSNDILQPQGGFTFGGGTASLTFVGGNVNVTYIPPANFAVGSNTPPNALSYRNTQDEFNCSLTLFRNLTVIVIPFSRLLNGPDTTQQVEALAISAISLVPVNDNAPQLSLSPLNGTVVENGALTLFSSVQLTDLDHDPICRPQCIGRLNFNNSFAPDVLVYGDASPQMPSITSTGAILGLSTSLSDAQAVLSSLIFQSINDNPMGSVFIRDISVTDTTMCGSGTSAQSMTSNVFAEYEITIQAVNDGPTFIPGIAPAACLVRFDEGMAPVVILAGPTITDPESDTIASLTVAITANLDPNDVITFQALLLPSGRSDTFVYTPGTGIGLLTLDPPQSVSSTIQTLMNAFRFENTGMNPNVNPRTISFNVTDNRGATGDTVSVTLCICPRNDPPSVFAAPGMTTINVPYETNKFRVEAPLMIGQNADVTDPDDINLSSMVCVLSGAIFGSLESLMFTTAGTSVGVVKMVNESLFEQTYSLVNGTAVAEYRQVLRSMTYDNMQTEVGGQVERRVVCTASDGSLSSSMTVVIPIVILPAPPLQIPHPGVRRATLRDTCISAVGSNYTLLDGETQLIMSFSITLLTEDGRSCAVACDPRNNIRLVFIGSFEGAPVIVLSGNNTNGTLSFGLQPAMFGRLTFVDVQRIMRDQVKVYSDFVTTETLIVQSQVSDWPLQQRNFPVNSTIQLRVTNRRPQINVGPSMCVAANISGLYLPITDDLPTPVSASNIISNLVIVDDDEDSVTAVTIEAVAVGAGVVADLEYRRSAASPWRMVPTGLSGIAPTAVGVPLFADFQLRVVPRPSFMKQSGCVFYTLRAFDNTTRNTSGLFPEEFPYSSESITCNICFEYLNRRPVVNATEFTLPNIFEDGGMSAPANQSMLGATPDVSLYQFNQAGQLVPEMPTPVSDILTAIGFDVDDTSLVLAVRNANTNGLGVFQYTSPNGAITNPIPSHIANQYSLLNNNLRLSFLPNQHANGMATIEARIFDGAIPGGGGAGSITTVDDSPTSPLSAQFATITVTVQPVNDLPIVDLNGPAVPGLDVRVQFTEEGPAVNIALNAIIIDVESPTLANLTILYTRYAGDSLLITTPGELSVNSETIETIGSQELIRLVVRPSSGDNAAILLFQVFLQSVRYISTNDELEGMGRRFNISAHDGIHEGEQSFTIVDFILVNDPPVINPPGPFMVSFDEVAMNLPIRAVTGVTITDDDDVAPHNASIVLTGLLNSRFETVSFGGIFAGLFSLVERTPTTVAYQLALASLTFTDLNTLFDSLMYNNTAAEPLQGLRNISVTITDASGGTSEPAVIIVMIRPVNDNAPLFSQDVYSACVPEGARNFSVISTITATDADSVNQPQMLRYSFNCPDISLDLGGTDMNMLVELEGTAAPGSGSGSGMTIMRQVCEIFRINRMTAEVSSCGGPQCAVPRRLLHQSVQIPLDVTDGRFSGSSTLNVTIVESNRNAPIFVGDRTFSIDENVTAGAISIQLSAVDGDVFPPNNEVQFALENTVGYQFSIDASTGVISSSSGFDYETRCVYELNVAVTDGAGRNPDCFFGGVMSSQTTVTVNVNNVNEFAPVVQPPPDPIAPVDENTSQEVTVLTLVASDQDVGCPDREPRDADTISFTIAPNTSPFAISNSGVLTVAGDLDFETAPNTYTLNIVVSDNGVPPMSTNVAVTLTIRNLNDNNPVFNPAEYSATITEATTIASVITFTATDADIMGPLTFSLRGAPSSFSVNGMGVLSVDDQMLDFETGPTLSFQVVASDGMNEGVAQVVITLTDVNDNTPIIVGVRNETYTIKQRPIYPFSSANITDSDLIHPIDGVTVTLVGAPSITRRLSVELPCDCSSGAVGTCPNANVSVLNVLQAMQGPVMVNGNGTATFQNEANFVSASSVSTSLVEGFVLSACVRIQAAAPAGYLISVLTSNAGALAFAVEVRDGEIGLSYLVGGVRRDFSVMSSVPLFDMQWHSFSLEFRFPQLILSVDQQPPMTMLIPLAMRPDGLPAVHSDFLIGCHNSRCFNGEIRAFVLRLGIANLLHFSGTAGSFTSAPLQFNGLLGAQIPVADIHIPGIRTFTTSFDVSARFQFAAASRGVIVSYGTSADWVFGVVADSRTMAAFNVFHRTCNNNVLGRQNNFFDFGNVADLRTGEHTVLVQYSPTFVRVILDDMHTLTNSLSVGQAPCFQMQSARDPGSFFFGGHNRIDGNFDNIFNGMISSVVVRNGNVAPGETACLLAGCGGCRCGGRCNNLPTCTSGDVTVGCRFDISKYSKCGITAYDLIFLSGAACTSGQQQMLQLSTPRPPVSLDAAVSGLPSSYELFSGAAYFRLAANSQGGVILVVPGVAAAMVTNRTTLIIFVCVITDSVEVYVVLSFSLATPLDSGLHHLAFSADMASVTVYLDGNIVGSAPRPASFGITITRRVYIGSWPRTAHPPFVGTLYAVTFNNEVLSSFQVRCVESCGAFLTVPGSLPSGIIQSNSDQLNTELVLTGNVFENIYGGVLTTVRYYNLFSEPPQALPFDHTLRIAVFDNGQAIAAAQSESIITVQSASPAVLFAGGTVNDFTMVIENGVPSKIVALDVQSLLPVTGLTGASVVIERVSGGCEFDISLSLVGGINANCITLTIVNGSYAVLTSIDPLNTLRTALLQVRYLCLVPGQMSFTTILRLTLVPDLGLAIPAALAATSSADSVGSIINITSINNGPCSSLPCQNGATCMDSGSDFTCTCAAGFTGMQCQTNIDDCTPMLCQNGGTCMDQINNFTCECVLGYTGGTCQTNIDDCMSMPCINQGTCTDLINSFVCTCAPGFTGDNCQINIDECMSMPCQNAGICMDQVNGFDCSCLPGFTGVICETDIDDCMPLPCENGGVCVDQVNDFTCTCATGFTGRNCQTNIDDCMPMPCMNQGTCTDLISSFVCTCAPGYTGDNCQINIDECMSMPCQNAGTCMDQVNGFMCTCAPGFTGLTCQININECMSMPCMNEGACTDLINSFVCACAPGFTGDTCLVNIDECESGPCINDGTCTDGNNAFTCECPAGFTGPRCNVDRAVCTDTSCQNGATCVEEAGVQFTCICASGFTGMLCEMNIDDCTPESCLNRGTCLDGVNAFTCTCAPGFTGSNCQMNIDDCTPESCLNLGTCLDGVNAFTCTCAPGFTGPNCEVDRDVCTPTTCMNGGTCVEGVGLLVTCRCAPGFTGSVCSVNIDECSSAPCQNGGECTDLVANVACSCPAGFTGNLCQVDMEVCTPTTCMNGGTCVEGLGAASTCQCTPSFTGPDCAIILPISVCDFTPQIVLQTQAALATAVTGCNILRGRVEVSCPVPGEACDITSLEPFSAVETAANLAFINTSVVTMAGLSALTSLEGLDLTGNNQLTSVAQLFSPSVPACSLSVNSIFIRDNLALSSLLGLDNVLQVPASFDISRSGVISMAGLGCLNLVGAMSIQSNPSLGTLNGLTAFSRTTNLFIRDNLALLSLDGLGSLGSITNVVTVVGNSLIANINGLGGLTVQPNLAIISDVCVERVDRAFLLALGPSEFNIIVRTRLNCP